VTEPRLVTDVPYSKWYDVSNPCGFTLPFNVTPADPTAETGPVVTTGVVTGTGGIGGATVVVNNAKSPSVVPDEFVATRRKR
jgi:hypothetical protein